MNNEEKNIDNTHPAELKRNDFVKIDSEINGHKKRIELYLISFLFFLFIFILTLINKEILGYYFSIIPAIIIIIFGFKANNAYEDLKDKIIFRRMFEIFLEENEI